MLFAFTSGLFHSTSSSPIATIESLSYVGWKTPRRKFKWHLSWKLFGGNCVLLKFPIVNCLHLWCHCTKYSYFETTHWVAIFTPLCNFI